VVSCFTFPGHEAPAPAYVAINSDADGKLHFIFTSVDDTGAVLADLDPAGVLMLFAPLLEAGADANFAADALNELTDTLDYLCDKQVLTFFDLATLPAAFRRDTDDAIVSTLKEVKSLKAGTLAIDSAMSKPLMALAACIGIAAESGQLNEPTIAMLAGVSAPMLVGGGVGRALRDTLGAPQPNASTLFSGAAGGTTFSFGKRAAPTATPRKRKRAEESIACCPTLSIACEEHFSIELAQHPTKMPKWGVETYKSIAEVAYLMLSSESTGKDKKAYELGQNEYIREAARAKGPIQ